MRLELSSQQKTRRISLMRQNWFCEESPWRWYWAVDIFSFVSIIHLSKKRRSLAGFRISDHLPNRVNFKLLIRLISQSFITHRIFILFKQTDQINMYTFR